EPLVLPARSPNLNAYAERWVRSVKEECLSKVVLFGERSLRRALSDYVEHYHAERNHQGKGNVLLFPRGTNVSRDGSIQCRERLGGLLRYYQSGSGVTARLQMSAQTETKSGHPMRIKEMRQALHALVHTQGAEGLLHLYMRVASENSIHLTRSHWRIRT